MVSASKKSTLPLLMTLIRGTDNHYLSVALDQLAFVAHRFYTRSNFHPNNLLSSYCAI